ncbi:DUF3630 family protein [Vibrio furnissii]|uniref:DUF3630 family protein n=1 Tax=Vibrio furnissii TaxID=29494 RepID=UPI00117D0978|nr:DUF3630 family protein [Vibrio furnissii]QTG89784.1 DUF3630 family protein [Vibrio furnissii]QTG97132.1 DUF3630 family protein [Vibrio furnissii]TRN19568.1 DUF3630 domain-containing protein [Vibrio furnissii]WJG21712.1 DUF3630 family protein [Vibrio furnissii]
MVEFGLREYLASDGRLIVATPAFDFDSFPPLGERLVALLSARVLEKQSDADLHSWLIDFEGCHLMLRAEHYSECVWLEAMGEGLATEELDFIASLLRRGI